MKSEVALVTMVPTEDELESMGGVGVEMLDGRKDCVRGDCPCPFASMPPMELVNVVNRVRV